MHCTPWHNCLVVKTSPGLIVTVIVTMTVRKVAVTADPERVTGSGQASAQQQNNLQTHVRN